MRFLPVVGRELRTAARRAATYWIRSGAALLALAIGAYLYLLGQSSQPAEFGFALFSSLAWLAFTVCALIGVRQTADAISEERRNGTLGLLFLTDLKGHDVVIGKLAAASLNALCAVLAMMPVLAISWFFGGVSARQFGWVVMVLFSTMAYSLALGLFVSCWFYNGRKAAVVAFLALALVVVGPWLAISLWVVTRGLGAVAMGAPPTLGLVISPAFLHFLALFGETISGLPVKAFWPGIGLLLIQAILWVVIASLVVPRVWHDRPTAPWLRSCRDRWHAWREGSLADRSRFRRELLAANPFFWLAARDRAKPAYVWSFLALTTLACLGLAWLVPPLRQGDAGLVGLAIASYFVHGVLKLWITFAAVHQLAEDRQSGAIELLLTSPLTDREYFEGQLRALYRQFGSAVAAVLLVDAMICVATLRDTYADEELTLLIYGFHMILLVVDAYALSWYGMWAAVRHRRPSQAVVATAGRILVLPWVVFFLFGTVIELCRLHARWNLAPSDRTVFAIWFLVGLTISLWCLQHGMRHLRSGFRQAAATRFQPKRKKR